MSVLICIATLTVAGAIFYHAIAYPFNAMNAYVKITQFTDYDLMYYANYLDEHRNNSSYIYYLNQGFEFDINTPNEYCFAIITVEFKNSGALTMTPKYLTLRADNDVIGFSESSLKYETALPGESVEVVSCFICRRNGMTDKELTDFILGLDFYLVQNDNILGEKQSKVSLKKFI